MTAYRQRALACAAALANGVGRPRDLRPIAADAASILRRDVYGWFRRASRGVYALTEAGEKALLRWPQSPSAIASVIPSLASGTAPGPVIVARSMRRPANRETDEDRAPMSQMDVRAPSGRGSDARPFAGRALEAP